MDEDEDEQEEAEIEVEIEVLQLYSHNCKNKTDYHQNKVDTSIVVLRLITSEDLRSP